MTDAKAKVRAGGRGSCGPALGHVARRLGEGQVFVEERVGGAGREDAGHGAERRHLGKQRKEWEAERESR